jgi:hypothetical protein
MPAPIALFAYRRPEHLARTIESLRGNIEAAETEVFVFSDAARNGEAERAVAQVRLMLQDLPGFKAVNVVRRDRNFGLAANITSGISTVLAEYESVIVVEDDLVVSPWFLRFMNTALARYRREPQVGSISGYCYPIENFVAETFFIRGADCWGWATWRDRWCIYNADGAALLAELRRKDLCTCFDFDGAMPFSRMLEEQIAGKNDSWAVRWHASCFLHNLLILYPGRSLVVNVGDDGSGTHTTTVSHRYDVALSDGPVEVGSVALEESRAAREAIKEFFMSRHPPRRLLRQIALKALDCLGATNTVKQFRDSLRSPKDNPYR